MSDYELGFKAGIELAAKHQCGDYNGGDFDWGCVCGAKGHWDEGAEDSWAHHLRSLAMPTFAVTNAEPFTFTFTSDGPISGHS